MLRPPRTVRVRAAGVALAVTAACLLAGCTSSGPGPSATPGAPDAPNQSNGSATGSPGASQGASAAPEETSEPSEPFAMACESLLTPDQVYAFNPNYGTDPGYEPSGTAVVAVVDEGGTACGWMNQTSGEIIEVAVATPSDDALDAHGNAAAASSNPVPTYGTPPEVEGYFTRAGTAGTAQVFTGAYWIVISSPELFEPGDAQQLVASVVENLPAG
ncbi:iron ABC transporter ATP-binding protein [Agromyces sp. LHK192]|uniref:iron ABC transporter ATP-binding protein n=1 Tax=Agromyces sp. LHK192 TaxID=2498704 RepID=UPI000FDC9663|nr:iron ABC transporter ATP-binding protein [Agromyces sp. LHK192]